MSALYDNIIRLLRENNIVYEEFDHEPILNYDDAERERAKFGWTGVESKNVFLKGANGTYYVYVTVQGRRVDFAKLKERLGTKVSLASEDDVRNVIDCVPGCVAPFGFSDDIITIVDESIFELTGNYLFSPGVTTKTIQMDIKDLQKVLVNHRAAIW